MTLKETLAWQRTNHDKITRLAQLKEPLACKLILAYRALYADQLNPVKQTEWMKIADDFARRDLTIATRSLLQDLYGHKIPLNLRRLDS